MRTQITNTGVKLWLFATDTYCWARRPGNRWPCSDLSGKRLFVEYDRNGLVDVAIDGQPDDCAAHELLAIVSDHLRGRLPAGHPCEVYFEG
ncbi:MAG: hypothetical protein JW888_01005 [Pirellulales bacterium]|nr:hypothetical protein [Pirellulales bacterium]